MSSSLFKALSSFLSRSPFLNSLCFRPSKRSFSGSFARTPIEQNPIYRKSLQWKRPPTIPRSERPPWNSVSLIGTVIFPIKKHPSNSDHVVWTLLEAKSSPKSDQTFRILLEMREKMAEISSQHIMQNDFVYVSGNLCSYTKVDSSGRQRIFHKVIVKELNYVSNNKTRQKPENLKPHKMPNSFDVKYSHLHLWQVFFANPHEWWDNRKNKLYPKAPDFKHKDTGECLWITPDNPPWVSKQLQLLDSLMAERGQSNLSHGHSRLSLWEYKD